MELLLSKIPPLNNPSATFRLKFLNLIEQADHLNIASGYISTGSLTDIKKIIELNGGPSLQLLIGMHHFEGFTRTQFQASKLLDGFLRENDLGQVAVSTVFKFHGKLYSFSRDGAPFAGIIGSSNLNNIADTHRSFEADLLVDDDSTVNQIDGFIDDLYSRAGQPFDSYTVDKFNERNPLLDKHVSVNKVSPEELVQVEASGRDLSFEIPIKGDEAPRSNLNPYFGRGRVDQRGFVAPRHWYEVELIVPSSITSQPGYPQAGGEGEESIITVYADDGWKFNCRTSGDYSKNFRSEGDLKILGKWIKGRLENSGCLSVGQLVTDEVLRCYGRNTLTLTATADPRIWLIDFGVN